MMKFLAAAVLAALLTNSFASAQSTPPPPPPTSFSEPMTLGLEARGTDQTGRESVHAASCEAALAAITAPSNEMDARLARLVAEMNEASEGETIDRMAAVITELVAQREAMQRAFLVALPVATGHAFEHLARGMLSGASASMATCPVLSGERKVPPERSDEGR
jgi:hypothetical protein